MTKLNNAINAKNINLAIELADMMSTTYKNQLNAYTITTMIKVYGDARMLGRALSLLNIAQELKIGPNEYHYGAIMQICRKVGQWEMAYELFNKMRNNSDIKTNTIIYNTILGSLGDGQQLQHINNTFNLMLSNNIPSTNSS